MATKTENAYLPDKASLTITLNADDATALASYAGGNLIAGTYQINYVLKTTTPNRNEKPIVREFVTGDDDPIVLSSSKNDAQESMAIVCLDDYFIGDLGVGGELNPGLTGFTTWELLEALFDSGRKFAGCGYSPAGIEAGTRNIALEGPTVTLNTLPAGDADQRTQASRFNATIQYENTGAVTINV